jgi:putative ABC transport system substrate-binding protein
LLLREMMRTPIPLVAKLCCNWSIAVIVGVVLSLGGEAMRRRRFIKVAAAFAAWPLAARAQQSSNKIPQVGVLWHAGNEEEEAVYLSALRSGFSDQGYVEGQNLTLINTFAGEVYERFNDNAEQLVRRRVDVIVAVTRLAAVAAQRATNTIPIVFVVVPDPIKSGLVQSLARPGKNVTGLTNMAVELAAKRLEIFKEVIPGMSKLALLVNATDPLIAQGFIEEIEAASHKLGMSVRPFEIRSSEDLDKAFPLMAAEKVDGVYAVQDGLFFAERFRIARLALANRLSVCSPNREHTAAGHLMSFGPDQPSIFRRAAYYVDRILKGTKAGDLPVEQPTKYYLVINLKTAKLLGIPISREMLLRADEVID